MPEFWKGRFSLRFLKREKDRAATESASTKVIHNGKAEAKSTNYPGTSLPNSPTVPSSVEDSNPKNNADAQPLARPVQLLSSSALSTSVESSKPTNDLVTLTNIPTASLSVEDFRPNYLWDEAYKLLLEKDAKLLVAHEKLLHKSLEGDQRKLELHTLVENRLEQYKNARLRISLCRKEFIVSEKASKFVHAIISARDFIGAAISAEPHAALAWAGVLLILPLLVNPIMQNEEAIDGFDYITKLLIQCRLQEVTYVETYSSSTTLLDQSTSQPLRDIYTSSRDSTILLYSQILSIQIHLFKRYSLAKTPRYLRDCFWRDDWRRMFEELKKTEESTSKQLHAQDSSKLGEINRRISELTDKTVKSLGDIRADVKDTKQDQQLGKLPRAMDAAFNASNEHAQSFQECLEGTSITIREEIKKWANNYSDSDIFWLSGMAGTGKSTIARTVAKNFHDQYCLGANFFFSKGKDGLGNAKSLFSTFSLQLTEVLPELKVHVCDAIQKQGDISHLDLGTQWKKLVLEPLQKLDKDLLLSPLLVFVIDALDECEGDGVASTIIELLMSVKDLKMIRIRIFITSRRDKAIVHSFERIPATSYREFQLQSLNQKGDISKYIQNELSKIKKEKRGSFADNWPTDNDIGRFTQKADCLFIYAATVCRLMMNAAFPDRCLSKILDAVPSASQSPTQALDDMYARILDDSIGRRSDAEDMSQLFKHVVGSIVFLLETVSIKVLTALLQLAPNHVEGTLEALHPVLDISQNENAPIQLFHLSFRDFLLEEKRDGTVRCSEMFHIQAKPANYKIFAHCLDLVTGHDVATGRDHLRNNMCDLQTPGAPADEARKNIDEFIPSHVQYACRYWPDHLEKSGYHLCNIEDVQKLKNFFEVHFLHWLEVLSLLGKMSEGVLMLTKMESKLTVSCSDTELSIAQLKRDAPFHDIIYDAKRFILSNRMIIEEAPLQVYVSALTFSPKQSLIRKHYLNQIPIWLKALPLVENDWSPLLQTLEGHSDCVVMVTFSRDGQLLASASADCTVRLWDAKTGMAQGTLEGHSDLVNAVTFSPDGQLLASASADHTVRVWDAKTGMAQGTLEGHSDSVRAVNFSPDGQFLASGSNDHTVRLWDAKTGMAQTTIEGHSGSVAAVTFSPNGQLLASASSDCTVRLWDARTRMAHGTLEGHSSSVCAVTFSPDCQLLATASRDKTVRLWDTKTGTAQGTFEGHSALVLAVTFSPDGQLLASASDDRTVRIWDAKTGMAQGTLEGHSGWVNVVTFSPDGQLLASGSMDRTVRLWDTKTGTAQGTLKGHSNSVRTVTFSPDGQLLASGSYDKTVRLWDPKTGMSNGMLEGHSGMVFDITFSPDGQFFASASEDHTVRLWDTKTGMAQSTLEGHSNMVNAVTFSSDGQLLASASINDTTVRLWDAKTGMALYTLKDNYHRVHAVTFSPNGQLLASASYDNTVRLWDAKTGMAQGSLEGHSGSVYAVTFSPDGQFLASGSDDHTVRLWDTKTGMAQGTLEGHSGPVNAVTFSPDGRLLASASDDHTVRLWDAGKMGLLQQFDTQHSILKTAFSADGFFINTNIGQLCAISMSGKAQSQSIVFSNWIMSGNWLLWNNSRYLWLPAYFRPRCSDSRENIFALGLESGHVTTIELTSPVPT